MKRICRVSEETMKKVVQIIKWYNATELPLYALMKPIPSDFTVIRCKEDNFTVQWVSFYISQNRQWVSQSRNIHFHTPYNRREIALGSRRLRLDVWDNANRTAYQFHGRMFQWHPNCALTKDQELHPKTDAPLTELFAKTVDNRAYLDGECNVQVV